MGLVGFTGKILLLLPTKVSMPFSFNHLIKSVLVKVSKLAKIGIICLNQPTEETPPIFADGYHYDIMCEQEIDFGINQVIVNNPKHTFAGY